MQMAKSGISGVQKDQSTTWKFECKECDKIFTGIESLEEHLKSKKHLDKMSV